MPTILEHLAALFDIQLTQHGLNVHAGRCLDVVFVA